MRGVLRKEANKTVVLSSFFLAILVFFMPFLVASVIHIKTKEPTEFSMVFFECCMYEMDFVVTWLFTYLGMRGK